MNVFMCLLTGSAWCGRHVIHWDGNNSWHLGPGMGWGMGGWGMGMGWLGMLVGIAFWVLVFLALILLVKHLLQSTDRSVRPPAPGRKTPLDIVKERYARGEIDREEFEIKKKDLSD